MRDRAMQIFIAAGVLLALGALVLVGLRLRSDWQRAERALLADQAIALVNTAIATAPAGTVAVQRRDVTMRRSAEATWSEGEFVLAAPRAVAAALRERARALALPLGLTLADDGEWEEDAHTMQRWSVREGGKPLVRVLVRLTEPPLDGDTAQGPEPKRAGPASTFAVHAPDGGLVTLAALPPLTYQPVLRPCPPQAAIIIDDLGYVWSTARAFLDFDRPLTLAVFPHLEHSSRIAAVARAGGREIMMHLPMESEARHVNLHTFRGDMADEELLAEWESALESLPGVVGVNNHQGSIMTTDAEAMTRILEQVRAANLFFIDSRTTKGTIARATAEELGLPTNENDLFLDNVKDVEYIKQKCRELVALALLQGDVIGIAHAHPATLQALQEVLPEFDAAGVQLVYVSALVN